MTANLDARKCKLESMRACQEADERLDRLKPLRQPLRRRLDFDRPREQAVGYRAEESGRLGKRSFRSEVSCGRKPHIKKSKSR